MYLQFSCLVLLQTMFVKRYTFVSAEEMDSAVHTSMQKRIAIVIALAVISLKHLL